MAGSFTDNINSFNVSNVSNHYTVADDRSEILTWLSPLERRIRHQDLRTRRADNVGEWLLQTDEFQRWCDGAHTTLFCYGDPAVGKTYLSSLVVDRLCDEAEERNITVACFYVDFAAREEQSPTNMLGSLLRQVVAGLERIPDEIRRALQYQKKVIGGRGLRVPEIVKMLQTVTSLQPTFICVDALDECAEEHRPEILNSLRQTLEKSPNTRVFLTGRRHIRAEIEKHLGRRAVALSIKLNKDDIVGYIRMRLSKDTSLDAMDSGLEAEIIKSIAENIPETFLLISLTMDAILGQTTAYGRRQKLRTLTEGLDLKDVYGATVEQIKEQGGERSRLGMATLMWVSHSERLLQLDELLHALAVKIGSTDLDPENIPSVETLLSCCLGLVVVDRGASTVRLIHFTLQEYLCTCPDLFGATHSMMAEICLTYLNFKTIKDIQVSSTLFALLQSTPFLTYSSLYWGAHARREASGDVVSLALKISGQIESHISTKLLLLDLVSRTGRYRGDIPMNGPLTGFTGLHSVSVFGIVEIVTAFMGQLNPDLNTSDFLGITPLIWAAICGQEQVVKLLLERQTVSLDKPDTYFRRTALSWAAGKGHEGIVRLLLGRASAKLDGTDGWWGKTPRMVNIVRGKRYVNPNWPDKYGQTPIMLAAEEGHEGVVQVLLGRKDVKSNAADGYGRTALLWASSKGREGVVKLLLERKDVNIDRPDKNGQTPLLSAAEEGHEGVVERLLGREDIDPNMRGKAGQVPLFLASKKGHGGVVELLLGREDVNPNISDDAGVTPLAGAALNEREGVVKLLLGREDVNPNTPDNHGLTPLAWAAVISHAGVVKLLLGREDVNPNIPDNGGRTPLVRAAWNGREGVVKLLLGREDANPNIPDRDGLAPLARAAQGGHEGVVKLLLGREDINLNILDSDGRTPLVRAAWSGQEGVVKLLVGREDVDPNIPGSDGLTPLAWAVLAECEGAVKILLERKDINPDTPNKAGQTPLWLACRDGYEGSVELLLRRGDVNSTITDKDGLTPLLVASKMRHQEVEKLLQAHKSVDPNTA